MRISDWSSDVCSSDLARRKAKGEKAQAIYPLALEAVQRIDALFAVERQAAGLPPAQRLAIRQELSAPLVAELERWMRDTGPRLSRGHDRSEEQTSELQSLMRSSYAVFCVKKTNIITPRKYHHQHNQE